MGGRYYRSHGMIYLQYRRTGYCHVYNLISMLFDGIYDEVDFCEKI